MKPQIAHMYRNGRFFGYGLAVNGKLLDWQLSAEISTEPNALPKITAVFGINNEMAENPVRIDLTVATCHR